MAGSFSTNLTPTPASGGSGTSSGVSYGAACPAGDKIVHHVAWFGTQTLSSISGGGLTWTVQVTGANGSEKFGIATADAPAGLSSGTTITANFSGGVAGDIAQSAYSLAGMATGTGHDGTVSSSAGGGATWSSGALSTTNADDVLCAFGTEDGSGTATVTPNGGWNEVHDWNRAASSEAWQTVYQIVSSAGSYTAGGTFSLSGTQSVGGMVALKAAAAAAGTYTPVRIANPRVGPMALRHQLQQRYRQFKQALTDIVFTDSGSGNITLAGTGTESQSHTASAAGTVTWSGTRAESQTGSGSGSGTVSLSGAGTESLSATDARSGTVALSGTRTESLSATDARSGTVTLGGSGVDDYQPPGGGGIVTYATGLVRQLLNLHTRY